MSFKQLTYAEALRIKDIKRALSSVNLKELSIKVKKTNEIYKYGENPYYDMEIENYILCPIGYENNWFDFIRNDYELIGLTIV